MHKSQHCRRVVALSIVLALSAGIVSVAVDTRRASATASTASASSALAASAQVTSGFDGFALLRWVGEQVAGGFVSGAGGLAFDGILNLIGTDKPDPKVELMQQELSKFQGQLDELKGTMNVALGEIEKTKYAALAGPAKALENQVTGAQKDFLDALKLAGNPANKAALETAVNNLKKKVDDGGGLADSFPVVHEAIVHSSFGDKPMYQALSNMVTGANTKLFTWRDSAAVDNVFQYLLGLQAMQFNLIVQVRRLEKYPQERIYQDFVQPLFGDQSSLQTYLATDAPTSGYLHEELAAELQRVPDGAVVQTETNLMWSIDMVDGAKQLTVLPSGPGYPSCRGDVGDINYYYRPGPLRTVSCLNPPTRTVGIPPRAPDSPAAIMADHLAGQGHGTPDQWNIATMAQWKGLFSGAQSPDGWLEKVSASDPTTCNAAHAGSAQAISDPKSCIWPRADFWVADTVTPRTRDENNIITRDHFHFLYAWHFVFLNTGNAQQSECILSTNQVDSSVIAGTFDKSIHTLTQYPHGCAPWLTLVRAIPANERYYFPL